MCFETLESIQKGRNFSIVAKVDMYESGCDFFSKTWILNVRERQRVDIMEMKCLKRVCSVRIDRVRNKIIKGYGGQVKCARKGRYGDS